MRYADVIMLSDTRNSEFHAMTCRALETLKASEVETQFVVHLVESNGKSVRKGFSYPDVDLIVPNERFMYNRFLNYGLMHCTHEWFVVANNDVTFTKGWFSTLMRVHELDPSILSLSPWEPAWHPLKKVTPEGEYMLGYRAGREVAGWCLAIHSSVVTRCNLFDEQFEFWYQDNDYAMTLKQYGIRHALVPGSIVHHHVSGSSSNFSWWRNFRMKNIQRVRYIKKWGRSFPR